MLRSVFGKTLYEKRWAMAAWAAGIFAMTLFTMSLFPYLKANNFDQLVQNAPKSLQGLLGETAAYRTVAGYVGQQIFAIRLPIMVIIMAIALFASVTAGDENRGTLESLLAAPVSRSRVLWQKFAAISLLLALACATIILGVLASFPLINGSMDIGNLAAATAGCWLLAMAFGALTFGLGASTGRKGLTLGISSALVFVSYLLTSLAPAVTKLDTVQKASIFYYYHANEVVKSGLRMNHIGVLVAVTVFAAMAGVFIFGRRDLVRDE